MRFGQEEKLRVVIAGGSEVWLVAADPLELSSFAEKRFIVGVEQPLATRQSKRVERYLQRVKPAVKR